MFIIEALIHLMVDVVNAVLDALAAAANAVLSILPSMPSLPTLPTPFVTAESWVAWFFPVQTVVDVLTTVLGLWILWFVVSTVFRWAKLISA